MAWEARLRLFYDYIGYFTILQFTKQLICADKDARDKDARGSAKRPAKPLADILGDRWHKGRMCKAMLYCMIVCITRDGKKRYLMLKLTCSCCKCCI